MNRPTTPLDGGPSREPDEQRSGFATFVLAVSATILSPIIVLHRALRSIWRDSASRGILIMAAVLLVAGTIIFMVVEDFSLVDSFYFSFITLATIGYGDFSPATDLGKLLTVLYSFAGLGVMAALIKTIASQRRTDSPDRITDDPTEA